MACDVLLLTEVSDRLELPGHACHRSASEIAPRRRWAAVLSQTPLVPLDDPHPASAAAVVGGMTFCSTVLPWKGCGGRPPWVGERHVDKTAQAIACLVDALPREDLVWGGDWNHALSGPEHAGSKAGREHVLGAVSSKGLSVPTAGLPHHLDGLLSIDHIAVGLDVTVTRVERCAAVTPDGARLSDHDAYVVAVEI